MVYTSYFAKADSIKANFLLTGIVVSTPEWWQGLNYNKLAPPVELLHFYKEHSRSGDIPKEKLEKYYLNYYVDKVLNRLDPETVYSELENMAKSRNKDGIVLLCYEKSSEFCHRHIIRDWFYHYGLDCKEYE